MIENKSTKLGFNNQIIIRFNYLFLFTVICIVSQNSLIQIKRIIAVLKDIDCWSRGESAKALQRYPPGRGQVLMRSSGRKYVVVLTSPLKICQFSSCL